MRINPLPPLIEFVGSGTIGVNVRLIRTWDPRKSAFGQRVAMLAGSAERAHRFWRREIDRGLRLQFDPGRLPA